MISTKVLKHYLYIRQYHTPMTEALYVFAPDTSDAEFTFWTGMLFAAGGVAGTWWLLRRGGDRATYNYRMLGAMLLFFCFLIGTGMAVFSWWSTRKISEVRIYADRIETPYGIASFDQIKDARIETERDRSFINPNITTGTYRLLLIEETNGKAHILSEENYELRKIMEKLKIAISDWKAEERN